MIQLLLALAAAAGLSGLAAPASARVAGVGAAAAPLVGCSSDLSYLNQITGWQVSWLSELTALAVAPAAERVAALPDWRQAPAALSRDVEALRAGGGREAPRPVVMRVLEQVEAMAAKPIAPTIDDPAWRSFLDGELRPAVREYASFLREEYLPRARAGSGLVGAPDGLACFERATRMWTSRSLTAAQLETLGEALLGRYRTELVQLAGIQSKDLPALLSKLRDQGMSGKTTRDELLGISRAAIERAAIAMPRWFEGPPLGLMRIEPVPASIEAAFPAGAFVPGQKGRHPVYQINLSNAPARRAMAEVIAFHEAVPGHALAFSRAGGRGNMNAGYVEGWAVYAEHLADEMGLYSAPEYRTGRLAKHLWAATRLIVEPGLHVRGWSRDQAIRFMRDHTALPLSEIEIEVDRYLAMPGQSLAYMVGYEALRAARAAAERNAGPAFDIRAFHSAILKDGPRPLDALVLEFANGR